MKLATTIINMGVVTTFGWLTLTSHAEIYKAVAADGRIVYTDNANKALEVSQNPQQITVLDKLTATTPASVQAVNSTATVAPTVIGSGTDATTTPVLPSVQPLTPARVNVSQRGDYRLHIVSPMPEMVYRRVVQPIDVQVSVSPALKAGDRLVYLVNGKHFATTAERQIRIPTDDYNPEKYLLTVHIENIKGDVIATAEQPFYILANNFAIQQQRKAAAEAKAAYDKLPWYKKIKININL